jgi:hypothetical protein
VTAPTHNSEHDRWGPLRLAARDSGPSPSQLAFCICDGRPGSLSKALATFPVRRIAVGENQNLLAQTVG